MTGAPWLGWVDGVPRITVTSVLVDDQAKALDFYTDKLGFVPKQDVDLGEYRWLTVVGATNPDGVELLGGPTRTRRPGCSRAPSSPMASPMHRSRSTMFMPCTTISWLEVFGSLSRRPPWAASSPLCSMTRAATSSS